MPVSVLVLTKNEEARIARCLSALSDFEEIIVVDSASTDKTAQIARKSGAQIINFEWNGAYPKKRQWCLDHIKTKHDWILFIDADELMQPVLVDEIKALNLECSDHAGFFVQGQYVYAGKILRYGLRNNKLALINKTMIEFPVIDDLDIAGMGEIEGHYQPVLKDNARSKKTGQLKHPLLHDAYYDMQQWQARHEAYARWQAAMDARNAWPQENTAFRKMLKTVFNKVPARGSIAFVHSYILKLGFLDGKAGLDFALSRKTYYDAVKRAGEAQNKPQGAVV